MTQHYLCLLSRLLALRERWGEAAALGGCWLRMADGWLELDARLMDRCIWAAYVALCDLGERAEADRLTGRGR
jgi:hypothetical protein